MTDITELAQSLKAEGISPERMEWLKKLADMKYCASNPGHWLMSLKETNYLAVVALQCIENNLALVEALEKAQQRNAELEAQNDYFASLVAMARVSADKAIRKFPQPNYVLLKVAEEAGEVVQAGVHYAENRMEWGKVEGEIVQLLAMLIRLVTEGDQVNGITPPALCSAGIKVEVE
ncbi:hypothetical protein [Klebsiella pneumoniae]|uniref:hypothetical protein n=1 Tax=Klebsiella pneumoniae TaxID=573 RepID=UPI00217E6B45|nr:hypothetical protein [Klebsiella pneumoniae]MCS5853901.1 hypothetical protein [Klebsiella pneumoniae subsp. pneumoniae]